MRPGVGLAGHPSVDAYGSWWFQWLTAKAVAGQASLVHAEMLFFPWGKELFSHTGANVVDALAILPVRWLLGPEAAWNALYIGAITTNGMAAGLGLLRLGRGRPAALAAAAATALHPYPLYELAQGRPTQAVLAPLIGCLLLVESALTRRHDKQHDRVLAGLALGLAGWTYWFSGLFGAIGVAALCLPRAGRGGLRTLAATGIVALIVAAPGAVPLLAHLGQGEVPGLLPLSEWWKGSLDLVNAQGDEVRVAVLALDGEAVFRGAHADRGRGIALGVSSLALAILAPGRWRLVAIAAVLLAVGPFVLESRNVVYLAAATAFPPLQRLYWPVRAASLLVVVGVIGASTFVERWRLPSSVAAAVLALPLGAELWVRNLAPLDSWRLPPAAAWRCLAGAGGANIDLPYGRDQLPLVHQTFTGLPMLNGMHEASSFLVPEDQRALRANNSYLRALLEAPRTPQRELPWSEADRAALAQLGYRWVTLRLDTLAQPGEPAPHHARAVRKRLTQLAGDPVLELDSVAVWAPWGASIDCSDAPPSARGNLTPTPVTGQ